MRVCILQRIEPRERKIIRGIKAAGNSGRGRGEWKSGPGNEERLFILSYMLRRKLQSLNLRRDVLLHKL